jgi:outer membrane lipoprotein-sorting protein
MLLSAEKAASGWYLFPGSVFSGIDLVIVSTVNIWIAQPGSETSASNFRKNGMIIPSPRRISRNLATAAWAGLSVFALCQADFARESAYAEGTSNVGKTAPAVAPAPAAAQPAPAPAAAQPAPQTAAPAAAAAKPASPVGAGSAWETKTQPATPAKSPPVGDSVTMVQQVNDYFNKMTNLQGSCIQTDPDNKEKKGKFYFSRPGKIRFDYAPPSRQKIVSDGKYLAVEDRDLNTSDRYPLASTPFRLLLLPDVDFLRDANILGVDQGADMLVLTVEDKTTDTAGRIRMFFSYPNLALKEWIITDPQGADTRVQLTETEVNKPVPADTFKFADFAMPNLR